MQTIQHLYQYRMKTTARTSMILLVFCLLGLTSTRSFAQERQVPFDSTGNLMVVHPGDAEKLEIFTEYPGFSEIRLFQKVDSSFVLEITYDSLGIQTRNRVNLSAPDARSLREKIDAAIALKSPALSHNQDGRPNFLSFSTWAAIAFYGPAITYIAQPDETASAALIYTVGGLGGFFIPYLATENVSLTKGQAALAQVGMVNGVIHTMDLFMLLRGSDDFTDNDTRLLVTSGIVGGIAGTAVGLSVGASSKIEEGRALAISSLWTTGIGLVNGAFISAGALELRLNERVFFGSELVFSAASLYAAIEVSKLQNFTAADAQIMSIAPWLGLALGGATLTYIEPKDYQLAALGLTACYGFGAYAGWELVKGHSFQSKHGTYVGLGTLGGALVGAGLGLAINTNDFRATFMGAALGATAGYLTMVSSNAAEAKDKANRSALEFDMQPSFLPQRFYTQGPGTGVTTKVVPSLSAQIRF